VPAEVVERERGGRPAWRPAAPSALGRPPAVPTLDLAGHVRAPLDGGEDRLLPAFSSRRLALIRELR
jgi:hypothetical protein